MKILHIASFILLAVFALFVGWNMGFHSRIKSEPSIPNIETEEEKQMPSENSNISYSNISNYDTTPFYNPFIPTIPPIDLDMEMSSHLKQFFSQAIELNEKSPDTFIISGSHKHKKVALTFDDGPDKYTTLKIMDILDQYDIKATFFVIGQNAEKYPSVIQSLFNNGHQIANHSWSHPRPLSLNTEKLIDEIDKTNMILRDILNLSDYKFDYFRPPYGLVTSEQLDALKKRGYKVICWSIDSMDWYTSEPEEIEKCVVKPIYPGSIILLHSAGGKNGRIGTIKALPRIINTLSEQGYEFVTIDELLNQKH